ncbi:MAG TPA: hypothetical protein VMX15_03435 [Candidatus Heimdallarchaeota archaeon]|nr:hypothetical protein [Candidatus Heimdallarchaeota archaeon]
MEKHENYANFEHVPVVRGKGGWALAFVHYSADPTKDVEWAEEMKARGSIEDWEQEMEINFSSVVGARCFESFSLVANTVLELELDYQYPVCLCCDFNVDPMCWVIAQVIPGEMLHIVDEIFISPGSVIEACDEVLDRLSDFYGELRIYGDATGANRSSKDQRSNYHEMKLRFMRAPFRVRMKVPTRNPSNVNSVRAFNRRLQDDFGNPRVKIHSENCKNLIRDMVEVIWEDSARRAIKKVVKREDPYFFRTHTADAAMSIVNREWPTRTEISRKSEEEQEYERKLEAKKGKKKKRKRPLIGALR